MTNWQSTPPDEAQSASIGEQLSALYDGECSLEQVGDLAAAYTESARLRDAWAQYADVGFWVRQQAAAKALPVAAATPTVAFVQGVLSRLEGPTLAPTTLAAASVVPAANDPVWKWKLVASMATLAAVVSVAWQAGMVGLLPTTGDEQWAQAQPGATLVAGATALVPVVQPSGALVLRDPQFEALMAAHRQYGGMTALQVPTGFLRNATYEMPQR